MKPCRGCQRPLSEQSITCPHCGTPYPTREKWDGWGYEYKSKATLFGLPLLHVSFKYRPNYFPVPARGIVAIGQFGCGVLVIAQFGVGLVGVCQFALAGLAVAQFGAAVALLAQIGVYLHRGAGQLVYDAVRLLGGF